MRGRGIGWGCWLALVAAMTARADDEPAARLKVVTPKDDGIVATALNDRGELVGFEWKEEHDRPGVLLQVPFYAREGQVIYLPLLEGYTSTFPAAVSDDGLVVGRVSKPSLPGVQVPLRNQAFTWSLEQGMRGLGTLEGDNASFACGIARDGRRISGFSIGPDRIRACVWDRTGDGWTCTALPQHEKLGCNHVPISGDGRCVAGVDGTFPCRWTRQDDGRWTRELIEEPGVLVPRGVNDAGTVVGVRFTTDGRRHAVLWPRDGGARPLPEPPGYVNSEAAAISTAGVVVGTLDGPNGSAIGPDAFAYTDGRLRRITEAGPNFASATAINDRGQISGVFEKDDEPGP